MIVFRGHLLCYLTFNSVRCMIQCHFKCTYITLMAKSGHIWNPLTMTWKRKTIEGWQIQIIFSCWLNFSLCICFGFPMVRSGAFLFLVISFFLGGWSSTVELWFCWYSNSFYTTCLNTHKHSEWDLKQIQFQSDNSEVLTFPLFKPYDYLK